MDQTHAPKIRTLHLTRAPLAALVGIGLIWGALVASIPDVTARIGTADTGLGLAMLAGSLSAWAAMAVAPRLDAWFGGRALPLAVALMAVSAVPLGFAATFLSFALAMVLAGLATGTTDVIGNGHIAELEARHDVALMNLNHASFSFAYALSAILTGMAREAGVPLELWFGVVGLAIAGLVLISSGARPTSADMTPPVSRGAVGSYAWIAGGIVLVAFFIENSTEIWAALHIERTLGGNAAEGALGPAMLGLTMGIGRLAGHLVTSRGQEARVISVAAMIAGCGLVLAALAPVPIVAYLGFGLVGFGASVIAPLALALAGQAAEPEKRTLAVSRAMLLGYLGFVVGPPLLGAVSDGFGLRASFGLAALAVLAVPFVLLPRLRRLAR